MLRTFCWLRSPPSSLLRSPRTTAQRTTNIIYRAHSVAGNPSGRHINNVTFSKILYGLLDIHHSHRYQLHFWLPPHHPSCNPLTSHSATCARSALNRRTVISWLDRSCYLGGIGHLSYEIRTFMLIHSFTKSTSSNLR